MRSIILVILSVVATVLSNNFPINDIPPFSVIEVESSRIYTDLPRAADVNYRLPNNTRPISYVVAIQTDIHEGKFEFTGEVKIRVNIVEDSTNITLHHRGLKVLTVKLYKADGNQSELSVDSTTYDSDSEFFVIYNYKDELKAGLTIFVHITYGAILESEQRGVFKRSYVNDKGETRWLLATHFAPHGARMAYPCYDEPALRANFTFQITHHSSYKAISNMPESMQQTRSGSDYVTTIFEPTPKMSTYITAFIVSDYASQSRAAHFPPINRVFSQPQLIKYTNLTLDMGIKVLNTTGEYLGVKYEMPKMDQVAMPSFAGAMENWGIVIYTETEFFYDENVSTFGDKENVVRIIAHEFAHHWFGNLVAIRWWTYLWMKEGFANYFQNKGVDLVYPEMQMMEWYVIHNVQGVLRYDASTQARPMTYYVEDPVNVSLLYDYVAYAKSGSVIRMFSHAFTEATFRKGLNYYLKKMQYSDAAEEDLFESIQQAVREDKTLSNHLSVDTIMLSWTRQAGFPLLYVNVTENGDIEVTQQRYFNDTTVEVNDSIWWIPYNFITRNDPYSNETYPDGWISEKLTRISPSDSRSWNGSDWVVFNKQQTGYYRIMYDDDNYKRISDALAEDHNILDNLSKAQLVNDFYNFVLTERQKWDKLLSLLRFLRNVTVYHPWGAIYIALSTLDQRLAGTSAYEMFENYIGELVTNLYKHVGIDDRETEPHLDKYSRAFAINWACNKGVSICLNNVSDKLDELINDGQEIHQNVKDVLYCAAMRNATRSQFFFVWRQFLNAESEFDKYSFLAILSCTRKEEFLRLFIESTLNSTDELLVEYRNHEAFNIISSIYNSGIDGLNVVLEFLNNNIDEVKDMLLADQLENLVNGIAERITSEELEERFEYILKQLGDLVDPSYALKTIESNMEWNENNLKEIEQFLHHYFGHKGANE